MKMYEAENVDEFIAHTPEGAQPLLNELRGLIKSNVPAVEEKISWGIPFYRYHGLLFGFSAFKSHIGFGFNDVITDEYQKKFATAGYTTGKKTVQIRYDQKLPADILKQMINAKVKLNQLNKLAR